MIKLRKIFVSILGLVLVSAILMAAVIKPVHTVKAANASELTVNGRAGLLMDFNSGRVVFEQNSTEHMPIASMVKIMTLLLTFEEVDAGNLTYETMISASENATSMGGSQAFLDTNSEYSLGELIKSIVVGSANDSCVAVGEHISGDVSLFVDKMNARAKELGMDDTNFANCTGLPAPNGYSCAKDVGLMMRQLLKHEDFYKYSTIWMFDFMHPGGRATELSNTNKLIRAYEGCDGGKTGFTNESKFCLAATAKRGNTRLISIVMGAESSKVRNSENAKLFNYGFANYETKQIVFKGVGSEVDYAVQNGKEGSVKLVPTDDVYYFMLKNSKPEIKMVENVNSIQAPIKKNDVLGEVIVQVDGEEIATVSLASTNDINKLTYLDIVNNLIANW